MMERTNEPIKNNHRIYLFDKIINLLRIYERTTRYEDEGGFTDELKIEFIQQLEQEENMFKTEILEKIVYQPVPTKLSPEELAYKKAWRLRKKQEQQMTEWQEREKLKINNSLKRKVTYCFICKKNVQVVSPVVTIKQKKNRKNRSILISCICEKCGSKLTNWGGDLANHNTARNLP